MVLLTVTTISQAAISEASASMSLVLSISGKTFDRDAEIVLHGFAFGVRVAVLQIDEAAIGQPQNAREIVQTRAL